MSLGDGLAGARDRDALTPGQVLPSASEMSRSPHTASPAPPGGSPTAVGMLMGALIVPGALGISTIAIALPSLSADLSLSAPQAAWVIAAFLLAQAMFVAIFGRVGDRSGHRTIVIGGTLVVATGAVLAASAGGFTPLIVGRALQGMGAAALWVGAFGTIGARFDGLDRARAVGVMASCLGIISGAGTLIGGVLTDVGSWRLVAALPALALIPAVPSVRLAPAAPPPGAARRVDVVGAALVTLLASVLVLLLQTPSVDLPAHLVAALAVVAVATGGVLIRRVRSVPDGFLPARVLRSASYRRGTVAIGSLLGAYVATLFAAPLLMLQSHDWTMTHVGLVLAPAAVVSALSARAAGRMLGRVDPFRMAVWSCVFAVAGVLLGAVADGGPAWTSVALCLVLVGLSVGQVALLAAVPLAVDPDVRGLATGLYTLGFLLGGAIGSAAVAGLSDPLGLQGALACVAALPLIGALLAWASVGGRPHGATQTA